MCRHGGLAAALKVRKVTLFRCLKCLFENKSKREKSIFLSIILCLSILIQTTLFISNKVLFCALWNLEKQKRYKGFCFCAFVYDLSNEIHCFKEIQFIIVLYWNYSTLHCSKYQNNVCKLKSKVVLELRRVASVKVWEISIFFFLLLIIFWNRNRIVTSDMSWFTIGLNSAPISHCSKHLETEWTIHNGKCLPLTTLISPFSLFV